MEDGLLEQLTNAVDKAIEYHTGIHPSPTADSLANLINTLEKKIKEVDLEYMTGMAKTFANMTGELTPESLVNAYMNSDLHKKNVEEIAESKRKNAEIVANIDKVIKEVNTEVNAKVKK